MHKILFLVPSLGVNGTSQQLQLLTRGVSRARFRVCVAVLAEGGSHAESLRAEGIEVHELGWKRWLDLRPLQRLRQVLEAYRPDVIHAWHRISLRALAAASPRSLGRLIVSGAVHERTRDWAWQPLDRWALRRAKSIVVSGLAEAQYCRQQKIPEGKIAHIPPGVTSLPASGAHSHLRRLAGTGHDARLVGCAGPLVPGECFQDAIWTLDILKYLFENLHLLLIGDGLDRGRLEQFVRALGAEEYVHFLGYQPDVAALFGSCELVWVPSRRHGGVQVALEAMAAGRPVVASRLPALAEIVIDGKTGFLIDPGDKVALARKTRLLLDDPQRARQMGEAGRQRVEQEFTAGRFVDRFARLYEDGVVPDNMSTGQVRTGPQQAREAAA